VASGWVFQETHKDCARACFASIFKLQLSDVPEVCPENLSGKEFWDKWMAYTRSFGYELIFFGADEIVFENNCIGIGLGHNPTSGHPHLVVVRGQKIVHDPSKTSTLSKLDTIGYFVAINPNKVDGEGRV